MPTKYFVDYENVGVHGLKNVSYGSSDVVFLFFTENASKVSLKALSGIGAEIHYISVPAGKQSLDMHLATVLGCEIGKNSDDFSYCVVSNDLDYEPIANYWKSRGITINRLSINTAGDKKITNVTVKVHSVKSKPEPKPQIVVQAPQDQAGRLNELVLHLCRGSHLKSGIAGDITTVILKHHGKSDAKNWVYHELVQHFGQRKGRAYYNVVKRAI